MLLKDKEQDKKYNPAEKRYGPDGSQEDLGVHPERREAEVDSLKKLHSLESAPEPSYGTKQEKKESDSLYKSSGSEDGGIRSKIKRFNIGRRRAMAVGGVAGTLLGTTIGLSVFISGPLQFIHLAQVITSFHFSDDQDFSSSRTSNLIRRISPGSERQDRNLGVIKNKIAVHYENKLRAGGIDIEYNRAGRVSALNLDADTNASRQLLKDIETKYGVAPEVRTVNGKKTTRLDFANVSDEITSSRIRRQILGMAVDSLELGPINESMGKRLLKKRAGVNFHPLKGLARDADEWVRLRASERYDKFKEKAKERRIKDVQEGTKTRDPGNVSGDYSDTEKYSDADRSAAADVDGKAEEIAQKATAPDTDFKTRVANVKAAIGVGVGVTAAVGAVCGLDALGDSAAELQESNVIKPLIRVGIDSVATGYQIMAGKDISFDELGVLAESFYDKESGKSWVAAESIMAQQGKEGGVPIPATAKPGKEKPGFFSLIDDVVSKVPGGKKVCDVFSSTFGQVGLAAAGILANATGPFTVALGTASEITQNVIAERLAPHLVRWLAGEAVDVANFAGPDFGSIVDTGNFLASNNAMLGMGGKTLSNTERKALLDARQEKIKEDMQTKSFYARFLKPTEANSLFASTVLESPSFHSSSAMLAGAAQYPTNVFSNIISSFRQLIPGVKAQPIPYDYGVEQIGYSLDEMQSEEYANPLAIADAVEPNLEELNQDYGKECFGVTIDPSTGAINNEEAPSYNKLEERKGKCNDTSNELLQKYRFYIADMITAKTMSCYEGIDEEDCNEIGFGANTAQQDANATNAKLYMVGDSLTVGMKGAGLDQKLINKGWQPTTTGVTGRRISAGVQPDGLTQIDQDTDAVENAGTVVVALGTNHWTENSNAFRGELQQIHDKIKQINREATIWWVNYYGTGKFSAPLASLSSTLKEFADSNGGRIIDWASAAEPYITGEDVHPNNYSAMTDVVVNALGSPNIQNGANPGITRYTSPLPSTGSSIQPKGITLHWWGSSGNNNIETLANTLRNRNLGVQFGITADGTIYQMTQNETDQVSHAPGANSTTFGIEIEGGPADFGPNGPQANPAKFEAVVKLVKYLSEKYNITTDPINESAIICGDVIGIHPHKAYNKCGNTKIDIDDAYFNAVMERVRNG